MKKERERVHCNYTIESICNCFYQNGCLDINTQFDNASNGLVGSILLLSPCIRFDGDLIIREWKLFLFFFSADKEAHLSRCSLLLLSSLCVYLRFIVAPQTKCGGFDGRTTGSNGYLEIILYFGHIVVVARAARPLTDLRGSAAAAASRSFNNNNLISSSSSSIIRALWMGNCCLVVRIKIPRLVWWSSSDCVRSGVHSSSVIE